MKWQPGGIVHQSLLALSFDGKVAGRSPAWLTPHQCSSGDNGEGPSLNTLCVVQEKEVGLWVLAHSCVSKATNDYPTGPHTYT